MKIENFMVVGSISTQQVNITIVSRSGSKPKRGFDFRHTIRSFWKLGGAFRTMCLNIRFPTITITTTIEAPSSYYRGLLLCAGIRRVQQRNDGLFNLSLYFQCK